MVIRQSGASCGHICPALSLLAVSSGCLQTAAVANGTAENMGCQCLLAMCPEVTAQKWTAGAHGSCFLGCEASSVSPPPPPWGTQALVGSGLSHCCDVAPPGFNLYLPDAR